MAAYNFQRMFAPKVKSGEKRCTIRARRKTGYVPTVGETITLYTGMRTTKCELLRRVKVKKVTPILVNTNKGEIDGVILDNQVLGPRQIYDLARLDGFESVAQFGAFFFDQHGPSANLYLIEW